MARIPITWVWNGLYPALFADSGLANEIRRLREHALTLAMVARNVGDDDLSAKLDAIAIEVLTIAAKLDRDKFAASTKSVAEPDALGAIADRHRVPGRRF